MKYERFTERIHGAVVVKNAHGHDVSFFGETINKALDRLAELEDKKEQGTLIELKDRKPLMWGKDGDTIHCQHCGKDLMGVFNGEVEVIQCPKCGGFVYGLVAEDYDESILKELQNG